MNLKAKFLKALFYLSLGIICAFGAAWSYGGTQAVDYPESQIELREEAPAQIGQPYRVNLYANIGAAAYGFGARIQYDPTVLRLELQTDVDGTQVPMLIGGPFVEAQRIRNSQESEGNLVTIDAVYTLLPPAEPASGEGFIGQLVFTVLQPAATQLSLISPRLIALDNGSALDLPVVAPEVMTVSAPEAVDSAAFTAVQPEAVQVVQPASLVNEQPIAQQVLTVVDTPRDVLAQMERSSTLMNAVVIGLFIVLTLLLIGLTLSSLFDAIQTSQRRPELARAYAYANRPLQPKQMTRAEQRQVLDSHRNGQVSSNPPVNPEANTVPSRTEQIMRMITAKQRENKD